MNEDVNEELEIQSETFTGPEVVVPVDPREVTIFASEIGEEIHIIHEITLGDLIISTLLFCILIFMLISFFIRGHRDV